MITRKRKYCFRNQIIMVQVCYKVTQLILFCSLTLRISYTFAHIICCTEQFSPTEFERYCSLSLRRKLRGRKKTLIFYPRSATLTTDDQIARKPPQTSIRLPADAEHSQVWLRPEPQPEQVNKHSQTMEPKLTYLAAAPPRCWTPWPPTARCWRCGRGWAARPSPPPPVCTRWPPSPTSWTPRPSLPRSRRFSCSTTLVRR